MENLSLVDTFSEFKEFKNIETETLMRIVEEVFRGVLVKKYGSDQNIDIIVNVEKGDLEIWRNRIIVADDELEDETTEVAYSEAVKIEPDFEIGEELSEEIKLKDFGRRDILAIRQNLVGKVQEYERASIFQKYKEKVGEIVICEVYQAWKREVLLLDEEGVEVILPKSEQIPGDYFRKGDAVKAIVLKVEMKNGIPSIILSRVSPIFLERLFEQEVPEIYDGLIIIKDAVRQPGERAKIAVESYDDRIDAVGSCVGVKGSRIHSIIRELRNENIDVINYTNNAELYITRALAPAKVISVTIDEENKKADVYMQPDQVSLAIGKGGYNIRLAGKLTGYEIEVYRDTDMDYEDVDLVEFSDEIEDWIIQELQAIGCDTAKSVLELSVQELVDRTDLEEETINNVIAILKAEFEED
ncbi:MAG: transcription termination factor NusA [Bacteroidales bacterium]|jgi:N utilization substance protein A|nr:transcription termination/antitermination protein NusA [Bacteroidales bacterium]MBQ2398256.1 transcription termination/antitermination protein NusA [Bacteroidales bacterium]MBQ5874218.1 transcription termination/antitermination protein NusA [Bacteroidales bacterium]MBQ5891834.1 transcription termination/antitermination protein NusA [Bacteroidales bacterium]MED9962456.1 transcription termination factor NusA [Bacteroidales bacterium]